MNVFSTAILIVFCSLLGSAFSDTCLECLAINSTVCEGTEVECLGNAGCMTASQIYKHGDKNYKSLYRSCANTTFCGNFASMTQDPNVTIRTYVSCCEGDNCNTNPFYIPTENSTLNGLKCPSAYCEDTTGPCDGDLKMMECRGSETQCINYGGHVQDPNKYQNDYSVQSCINPLGCRLNFKCLIAVEEIKNVRLECSEGVKA
ncbi:phospholipase A2 inhibitor and Ly6/PLAUR domain-containing protein-like [Eleutherodactylus coqui]|uniref:phospholipase A2 inhibitor and Ly6/PLAUR domain-containing protein-like n=1 Tax=Eleutherodactylus coqui TaxID=57060 RepID=UPI0034618F23